MLCFSHRIRVCCIAIAAALVLTAPPRTWSAEPEEIQNQIDEMQQGLIGAQKQLLILQSSDAAEHDEGAKSTAQALMQEIAGRTEALEKLKQMLAKMRDQADQQAHDADVTKLQAALAQSQSQAAELNAQLAKLEQEREEQPIDNAQFKIFALKHLNAQDATMTVQEILSGNPFRISVDHRSNSLVVAGDPKTLDVIAALIERLDVETGEAASTVAQNAPARSLLVRVFWLADGLAEGEGEWPIDYLPQSVVEAMLKLGIRDGKIVGHTVNSISRDGDGDHSATFSTNVPALIFKQPATLTCSGGVKPIRDNRVEMEAMIQAMGQTFSTDLKGSVVAPLGHYMVLGTANSLIPDPATMPQANPGMGFGRGGRFDDGGGFDGGRGAGRGRGAEEAREEGGEAPAANPQFKTSRFAFVVQVVDAESYAPKE